MTVEQVTLAESAFVGRAFLPDGSPTKAVIVVTGSDGGLENAAYIAQLFAEQRIAALAMAYFRHPEVGRTLRLIPLEYMQRAASWLKQRTGLAHVAAYGVSKGGEYVLSAAARMPDIDCVVAVVPSDYVAEGIGQIKSPGGASSWSYAGQALPYAHLNVSLVDLIGASLRHRELHTSTCYEQALLGDISESELIPVEHSRARILLLSAGMDSMWPSQRACERLVKRLDAAKYPLPFHHEHYPLASHIMNPVPTRKTRLLRLVFRAERQHPTACQAARVDAFRRAVQWITCCLR